MRKIFIGGCDRSGTTFLASILGSAKNTIVTPESLFKNKTFDRNFNYSELRNDWRFLVWDVEFPSQVQNSEDFIEEIVSSYIKQSNIKKADTWIDHSPNNIEFYYDIKEHYSDCRFIHIVRNPYDVINSILPLEWGPNSSLIASLFWLKKISAGLAVKCNNDVSTVKYEDLLEEDSKTRQTLFDELNLKKEDGVASVSYFLPEFTRIQHSFVGKKKILENRRSNLRKEDIYIINKMCGPLIRNLGYEQENVKVSYLKVIIWLVFSMMKELVKRFILNPFKYKSKRVKFYENKNK